MLNMMSNCFKNKLLNFLKHPYFTLLCQSLASIILGFKAAFKHVPDIYLDTMGYAWTFPVFKHICSSHVGAYVHYPTISTDMLSSVSEQKVAVNYRRNQYLAKYYFADKNCYLVHP